MKDIILIDIIYNISIFSYLNQNNLNKKKIFVA